MLGMGSVTVLPLALWPLGEVGALVCGFVKSKTRSSAVLSEKALSEQFQAVLEAGRTGCGKGSQPAKLHFWLNLALELWVMGLALFASE